MVPGGTLAGENAKSIADRDALEEPLAVPGVGEAPLRLARERSLVPAAWVFATARRFVVHEIGRVAGEGLLDPAILACDARVVLAAVARDGEHPRPFAFGKIFLINALGRRLVEGRLFRALEHLRRRPRVVAIEELLGVIVVDPEGVGPRTSAFLGALGVADAAAEDL